MTRVGVELLCGSNLPEMRDVHGYSPAVNTVFFKIPSNSESKNPKILNNLQIILDSIFLLLHTQRQNTKGLKYFKKIKPILDTLKINFPN